MQISVKNQNGNYSTHRALSVKIYAEMLKQQRQNHNMCLFTFSIFPTQPFSTGFDDFNIFYTRESSILMNYTDNCPIY